MLIELRYEDLGYEATQVLRLYGCARSITPKDCTNPLRISQKLYREIHLVSLKDNRASSLC